MSLKYDLTNASGIEVTIKNVYDATKVANADLALDNLDQAKGEVWNGGIAQFATGADALIADATKYTDIFTVKNIVAVRLYGNNSYVYLAPGDEVVLKATRNAEIIYYTELAETGFISVVTDPEVPTEEETPSV